MSNDLLIRDIRKNSSERIRVCLRTWKNSQFLDIRNFYDGSGKETEFRATKKGIAVQLSYLPELKKGIEEAIEKAEAWSVENDTE